MQNHDPHPATEKLMTIEITRGALRERVAAFLADDPGRLLVGGRWTPAHDGATFATLDPATGETLARIARGSGADADAAVAAASDALASWAGMRPADRGALLWRIADLMQEHLDDLAELETLDQGKSVRTSRFGEVPAAINQFRYYAGWPTKILGETIPTSLSRTPQGKEVFA
jgi:phenylacetaldehyde dehydrogenase